MVLPPYLTVVLGSYYVTTFFLIGKEHTCMCTDNHVCLGRIQGSRLREGANARPRMHARECRATQLTPLPQQRGLPRESPPQTRVCVPFSNQKELPAIARRLW
jgi:hypothetical protein